MADSEETPKFQPSKLRQPSPNKLAASNKRLSSLFQHVKRKLEYSSPLKTQLRIASTSDETLGPTHPPINNKMDDQNMEVDLKEEEQKLSVSMIGQKRQYSTCAESLDEQDAFCDNRHPLKR